MFKHIWYLLTKQSKSKMTYITMCWEWNWPNFWAAYDLTWFRFDFSTSIEGDHSPSLRGLLVVFNLKLLDFRYYNMYHEVEDEEDEWGDVNAAIDEVLANRKSKSDA